MKWRKWHIIIMILSMFILQGCNQIDINVEGKIEAPEIKALPIQGTWKVQNYMELDDTIISKDTFNGEIAAFDKDVAVLLKEVCSSPEYKIKSVSAEQYFLYKYKVNAVKLGVKAKNVDVITISTNKQPFHDFIKIDDSSILVYEDKGFLYMNKVSDKVDNSILQKSDNNDISKDIEPFIKTSGSLKSGVFLGLRTTGDANNIGSSYRTLWIASVNKAIRPVYEMKQLLVPRKTGFWEVDYWSQKAAATLKGTLYAHSLIEDNSDLNKNYNNLLEEEGRRDILFVGNDYIGTEYKYLDPESLKETAKYQVLPIDNLKYSMGVNISDVVGEDGLNALIHSSQSYVMSLDKSKAEQLQKYATGENFSLTRRNGQWVVTGRLDYVAPVNGKTFEDFDIYLLPPQKLVNYDELKLPWNYIKVKIPDAVDVYTSPNKDMAIIITRSTIEIYTIENEKLSEKPVQTITLQKGETAVMAEWASGSYVDKWEEVIRPRSTKITGNIE